MVSKILSGKVMAGVGVALVIALAFMWRANANLNEELGEARQSIRQAEQTNRENQAAIEELRTNLNTCVEQRRVDQQANEETIAQLESDLEALSLQEEEVRVVREEIFREPSCNELGELDIADSCPALSRELWGLADRLDAD